MRIVPNSFATDPAGWMANQSGHVFLGMIAYVGICAGWLSIAGEFPVRVYVVGAIGAVYLFWVEIAMQGWQGADTIEDTVFVAGYGAGGLAYSVREVEPGSGSFHGNIWDVVPFVVVCLVHIVCGLVLRVWNVARRDHD